MLEIMLVSIVVNVLIDMMHDMVPGEQFILIAWLSMVR